MSRPPQRLAVVTGGHPFDVPGFHSMIRAIAPPGFDIVIQHLDDLASSPIQVLRGYDAVLFYFFPQDGPNDQGLPGHQGKPRWALEQVLQMGTGVIVLHHALLAYPQWELWDQVVGISGRSRFTYHPGQSLSVRIADPAHAITQGLEGWDMVDETYQMTEPDGVPLIQVEHPHSMRTLGWARHHGPSRIVCLQSGHDADSWSTAGFQQVLRRGVAWAADSHLDAQRHADRPALRERIG